MNSIFQYQQDGTRATRARPIVLGTFTILTLVCTVLIDIGTPHGVAAWAPYSIAIVLALQWKGAHAIVPVTAAALILMVIGFFLGPIGDFHTATTNRAIGAATLTTLALVCLYIDWRRSKHHTTLTTTISRLTQLQLYVNSLKTVAVVLSDLRGRVTEWNPAAQELTGYTREQMIGQPIFRVFPRHVGGASGWPQAYRKARTEGAATYDARCHQQEGGYRHIRIMVKPLRTPVGRLHGYSLTLKNPPSAQTSRDESNRYRS